MDKIETLHYTKDHLPRERTMAELLHAREKSKECSLKKPAEITSTPPINIIELEVKNEKNPRKTIKKKSKKVSAKSNRSTMAKV